MVSILSLWLPVLISAVLVFVVSSVIHMVLLRTMFDGLIYALLTAGTFGWLWP